MPVVQMPDGSQVQLPDNPSPELRAAIRTKVELGQLQSQRKTAFDAAQAAREAKYPGKGGWFADATSPELEAIDTEISKRQDALAKAKADSGGFLDKAKYYGGQTASAIGRGLLSIPASAAAAGEALNLDRGMIPGAGQRSPEAAMESLGRTGMQPQTKGESYAMKALEGATGAVAGPGGLAAPIKSAVTGVGSAMGSEAAANTLGDNVITRVLGGLLGGAGTATLANRVGRVAPQTQELAREAVEGVDPAILEKAKAFMQQLSVKGVSVDIAQALEAVGVPPGNMATIRNVLANNRNGNQVQQNLREQPKQLQVVATSEVGGMPGNVYPEGQAANNLQETATQAIQATKDARTKLWQQTVKTATEQNRQAAAANLSVAKASQSAADQTAAGAKASLQGQLDEMLAGNISPEEFLASAKPLAEANARARKAAGEVASAKQALREVKVVPPQTVLDAAAHLQDLIKASPNTGKAQALTRLQKALFDPETNAPITNPTKLNDILVSEANKLKSVDLASSGVDAGTAKWIGGQIQNLRQRFGQAFDPIRQANTSYKEATENSVNPLRQGPVGQLAGKGGYKADVQSPLAKMNNLFSAGVDPQARTSPIRTAAAQLAKVDKEAFADAAKTYYSGKVSEAFDPTVGGAPATNADAASRLWKNLFSNEKQYQGMKDTVTSVAKTYGLSEAQAAKGLDSFAQIVKALKSRPSSVGGLQPDEVFELSGKSYGADALRVFGFLPFERVARAVEGRANANVFKDFDQILTTPEGVQTLIKLSKQPVMSNGAISALSTYQGAVAGGTKPAGVTQQ